MNDKKNRLQGLYVLTDSELAQQSARPLVDLVEQAIRGGARLIQYRSKLGTPAKRKQEAMQIAQLCRSHQVTFLVNDDADIALAVDADGVHLGQTDITIEHARQKLGASKIIGLTCHNEIEFALNAQQRGADYVAFGRFFPSHSKPEATPASLSTLVQAKQQLSIPVCAIGGITHSNAPVLIEQGADMLAVIHAVLAAPDIEKAARDFVRLFK